jgi:hypothetical protein
MRSLFRDDPGQLSERSDAGSLIVEEVIGFVKSKSGAQRRMDATSGERGAGKGAAALVPASAHRNREREQRSESKIRIVDDGPFQAAQPTPLAEGLGGKVARLQIGRRKFPENIRSQGRILDSQIFPSPPSTMCSPVGEIAHGMGLLSR